MSRKRLLIAMVAGGIFATTQLAQAATGLTCGPPRTNLGPGPEPRIQIWSEANYQGNDGHMLGKNGPIDVTGQACSYIGDADGAVASSVKVLSGTWRLWQDKDYQGRYIDLPPGEYPDLATYNFNDALTSFEPIKK